MKKIFIITGILIIAVLFLFSCNEKLTTDSEATINTEKPIIESNVHLEETPSASIIQNQAAGTEGLYFGYTSYEIPEHLFISEKTTIPEKYPIYSSEFTIGYAGPLYENSEENRALAENNLKDFIKVLYGEDKVSSFELEPYEYFGRKTEIPEGYITNTDNGNIAATAKRVRVMLDTPDTFSEDAIDFINNNEIISAMMKYAGLTDPMITVNTRFIEDSEFTVFDGIVSAYHLQFHPTDGILGEYETIPYNIALKAVTDAYPDVDTDSVKAYVYYNVGFYDDGEAKNEQKRSGCLFPCYRFIVPGVDKDGNDAYAFVDVAMTTFEAMTQ